MRTNEWEQSLRSVLPSTDGFAFRGSLCYSLPVDLVLFGVSMGNSRSPEHVFISRVAMPLFIPSTVLTGGEDIRGSASTMISVRDEDVAEIAGSVLREPFDQTSELERILIRGRDSRNTLQVEEAGYAALVLGDTAQALRILEDGLVRSRIGGDDREFVLATRRRMELISDTISAGDVQAARHQLSQWANFTAGHLGIPRGSAER